MSKLIVISSSAAEAVNRAESMGLTRDDIVIVTSVDRIRGYKDMLMIYAGAPYLLDDFDEIIDYAVQHDIKSLKIDHGNDFVAREKLVDKGEE